MICFIGSETTKNYGLLNDLVDKPGYRVVYAKPPFYYKTIVWKVIRKIRSLLLHKTGMHMVWEHSILRSLDRLDRLIVVDTALRWLELSFLHKCKELRPDLQIDCLLLNSTSSMAFSERRIRSKFDSFPWSTILTFDPLEAEKNAWVYIGLHYYSKHSLHSDGKSTADLFYAGSIMGERGKYLRRLLSCFNANHVNCRFICPSPNRQQYYSEQPPGMEMIRKRIPYQTILKETMGSNCILEVLQEGQGGSTLRYMEAVCYNKKLLTTNTEITKYPFYDERYMKVFSSEADIDYEWVKKPENVDYGYRDEFSPLHFFEVPSSDA